MFKLLPEFHRGIYLLTKSIVKKIDEGVIKFDEEIEQLNKFYEESKKNFSGFGKRKQRTSMLKSSIKLLKAYQKTVVDPKYLKLDHKLISNDPEIIKGVFERIIECEQIHFDSR